MAEAEEAATEVVRDLVLEVFRRADAAEVERELSNAEKEAENHCKLEVVRYRKYSTDESISYRRCLCFSEGKEPLYRYICKPTMVANVLEELDENDQMRMLVSQKINRWQSSRTTYELRHYEDRATMCRFVGGELLSNLVYANKLFEKYREKEWRERVPHVIRALLRLFKHRPIDLMRRTLEFVRAGWLSQSPFDK